MIERTFQNIPEGKLSEADQQSFLVSLGWSRGTTWQDLLCSMRVLMISEAGAGKTYECREQAQRLWDAGEPAFFVELSGLATGGLRSLLYLDEVARLDDWLSSQSDVATFFLDSIDELKLTRGSFEQALKLFKTGIEGQLGRARIVITTRPTAIDEKLMRSVLPVPPTPSAVPSEESFVKIAMRDHQTQKVIDSEDQAPPDWRTVALIPLSDTQIIEFCSDQRVEDPAALQKDLKRRNAEEFARRPQDLIELCADWREHKRIRTHRDQVAANVRIKLLPRDDRHEPAQLSVDKAVEGASRLALAMMFMRRMTIRHSAASDIIDDEAALDPAIILSDWNPNERKALLERPLFGFASYGRVRFHHRSVVEYLAAERLRALRALGMSFPALKRLIFAQTKGKTIVRPSKRPIAGWLALTEDRIFEMLRDSEPAVLLNEGDPEALSQSQRSQALHAYVERYGLGGWRELIIPHIQVHRFASAELADDIIQLWGMDIENPDVRLILLHLIEAGRIGDCADIAHGVAVDALACHVERLIAVDAMVAIKDPRLKRIATELATADNLWPSEIARAVLLRLFPRDLSIEQLYQTLSWLKEGKRSVRDLSWQLPRLIANAELDPADLTALRDGLVKLLSAGLRWQKEWPHIVCDRPYLSGALAAACVHGLEGRKTDGWLYASVLTLRLHNREYSNDEAHKALHERLSNLPAAENARLFWAEDCLVQSLNAIAEPWRRLAEVILNDGPVELRAERDLNWIKEALGEVARLGNDRAMLLEAAMRLTPCGEEWRDHVSGLKELVADQPNLIATIDERLKRSKHDKELERWKKEEAEQERERDRQTAEALDSWVKFWREVAEQPDSAFSSERSQNTAWNLWRVMRREGEDSRASGWNRRLIEDHFGRETADRLRRTLMNIWRQDRPTLPSDSPEGQRNQYFLHWELGLASLYAEAEDPSWAEKLTDEEAKLAARYAPIELNGLPNWMESLVDVHPSAVDAILGTELSWELKRDPSANGHSMLLQDISLAPEPVARLFISRLREWLDRGGDVVDDASDLAGSTARLRQVIGIMLKLGDKETRAYVLAMARQRLQSDLPEESVFIWLPTLMRLDPALGVSALEDRIRTVAPGTHSEAVTWFSVLYGDPHDAINLKTPGFTPKLLLRLLRLAYRHVRPGDDVEHEDPYSPDTRDNAEHARNKIVNALLEAKGEEGWAAKLEMANDPLCAHFRDRILAVAEENWAQEIDSVPFDEAQAVALDKSCEAPPSTNETMFAVLCDRLEELNELLLRDMSPRETWAGITAERIMRREIARELKNAANDLYKVDQEAVTADENKTDIRLRSVVSDHEAVIELKIADDRSARDLRDTIYDQLVTKYMAAENSKSGCLLVTLAKDRKWDHPDSGKLIGPADLVTLLNDEAKRVEKTMGGALALSVRFLDLRPRLASQKL